MTLPRGNGIVHVKGRRETESRQYRESPDKRIAQVIKLARKSVYRQAQHDPYRKPTQVGEERILRCSSESRLRN